MNTHTENIFDIPNAKEWHCNIHEIDNNGMLKLRVFKPYSQEKPLWIIFKSVLYCDVSTVWKGAEFSVDNSEDFFAILHSLIDQEGQKIIADRRKAFKLFKAQVETSSLTPQYIRILAEDATLERV